MDWELYERYRSTLLLAGLLLVSSLLLAFQKTTTVQRLRAFMVRFTVTPQRLLSEFDADEKVPVTMPPPVTPVGMPVTTSSTQSVGTGTSTDPLDMESGVLGEERRKIQVLRDENKRLRDALDLKDQKWPNAVVAHVSGRDPQRWFQEIVLDKGKADGLDVDYPVVAILDGREALAGRLVEVSPHVAKAMLLQDPLSEVAAVVLGPNGEDGVVEGTNTHDLILKFLDRGSQVKVGDSVVTSGLGKLFPPGVPIGYVEAIEPDPRQLFLQARLKPAVASNQLRTVLILIP